MEELLNKREKLMAFYHELSHKISDSKDLNVINKLKIMQEETVKSINEIDEQYKNLEAIEIVKKNECEISDGEIDLYLEYHNLETGYRMCKIFLHNTSTYIGDIKFFGKSNYIATGNIAYNINQKFRGHGYALKALKLITDKIYEDGIDKVYIAAFDYNIPSIKTIEKFGGVLVENNRKIRSYECDLKKIKNNNIYLT